MTPDLSPTGHNATHSGSSRSAFRIVAAAALMLLAGTLSSAAPDASAPTAILLIAREGLPDPDFADAVVLVMNNLGPAPAGIIINKPTHVSIGRLFPDDAHLTGLAGTLYFGGPVELDSVWFLFRAARASEHAVEVCPGLYVSADPSLLRRLLSRPQPLEGLRIFLGHSGWLPGQLESEIARGDWRLEHASANAVFERRPEHAWPATPAEPEEPATSI